jgi:hypothetical protein
MDALDRFCEKIAIQESGCVLWTGSVFGGPRGGYGQFSDGGKNWRAHRWFYHHYVASLSDDDVLCHTAECHNPLCVNDEHIYIGTHKTNAADRRSYKGIDGPGAKLSEEEIMQIKASTLSSSVLAVDYGVHRRTIWRHRRTQ